MTETSKLPPIDDDGEYIPGELEVPEEDFLTADQADADETVDNQEDDDGGQ
jgi:hypothetical protein